VIEDGLEQGAFVFQLQDPAGKKLANPQSAGWGIPLFSDRLLRPNYERFGETKGKLIR
jgi:hypothetical protein